MKMNKKDGQAFIDEELALCPNCQHKKYSFRRGQSMSWSTYFSLDRWDFLDSVYLLLY